MQAKDNGWTGETQPLPVDRGWGYSPAVDSKVFTAIAATGFSVAFFHAAIPTHWLPFVLTARVQKWNKSKTLLITTLAFNIFGDSVRDAFDPRGGGLFV